MKSSIQREIGIKLAPQEQERLASAGAVKPQAYEAYLNGLYLLNRRTLEASALNPAQPQSRTPSIL